MKYVQTHFWKKHFCALEISCVRSSHDLCARAHAHSLEGTLFTMYTTVVCVHSLFCYIRYCGLLVMSLHFMFLHIHLI